MTPNRDAEIRRICQEALEQPSADRARFLSGACAGDESLRRGIEALLAHDVSADRFLAMPAFEIEAQHSPSPTRVRAERSLAAGSARTDVYILTPVDWLRGNRRVLFELPNRRDLA